MGGAWDPASTKRDRQDQSQVLEEGVPSRRQKCFLVPEEDGQCDTLPGNIPFKNQKSPSRVRPSLFHDMHDPAVD